MTEQRNNYHFDDDGLENEFVVNDRFEDFIFNWDYKINFLVGGYGSSKSYHVASKILLKLQEEKRKALVVREVFDTIRDSCFSLFEDVATNMGIYDTLTFTQSPMQIRFPNGSKIIFRGMDRPAKLKSINDLSLIWVEECSEVKYEGYKELLGRLRHLKMSNHIICSTNPVGTDNWTYSHFFKDDLNDYEVLDDNILYEKGTVVVGNTMYHHSTCDDNYFLPQDYLDELEEMKRYDKDLYRVARLGRYGVNGTKVLPNFKRIKREEAEAVTFGIPDRWHKYGLTRNLAHVKFGELVNARCIA